MTKNKVDLVILNKRAFYKSFTTNVYGFYQQSNQATNQNHVSKSPYIFHSQNEIITFPQPKKTFGCGGFSKSTQPKKTLGCGGFLKSTQPQICFGCGGFQRMSQFI